MFVGVRGVGANREGAVEVAQTFGNDQTGLRRRRTDADEVMVEGYSTAGAFEGSGSGAGEQVGLVIRTIPTAPPMQRDRDEQIDRVEIGSADDQVSQQRTKEAVELALMAELQGQDELAQRAVVFADAEGARHLGSAVLAPDAPLSVLVPSFLLSEVERAFQVGFLIFLPFLIIDLVVAAVLMSMGMMMVPPVMVSLPVKVILFVLVDGWHLVVTSLLRGLGAA